MKPLKSKTTRKVRRPKATHKARGGWASARRLMGQAFRAMPGSAVMLALLAMSQSVLEGTSLMLVLPVLGSLGIGSGSNSSVTDFLRAAFGVLRIPYNLASTLAFLFLVGFVTAVVGMWQTWVAQSMLRQFVAELQIETYRTVINSRSSYLSRQKIGDTIAVLTKFIEQSGNAFILIVRMMTGYVVVAALIVVAMSQAWPFVLATLGVFLVLLWPMWRNSQILRRMVLECHTHVRQVGAHVAEHLRLSSTIKAFGAQTQSVTMIATHVRQTENVVVKLKKRIAVVRCLLDWMMMGLLCVAIYLGVEVLSVTVDRLLLLVGVFIRLVPNLIRLVNENQQLPLGLVAFDSVMDLNAVAASFAEPKGGLLLPEKLLVRGIDLQRVCVSDQGATILSDITMSIAPHTLTALVGASGAGKSTVAAVVLGLVEPSAGVITIDAQNLTTLDRQAWRRRTGYVSQDSPVFHGTIRENLSFAVPGADDIGMYAALDEAGVGDFVRGLPRGLDSEIGEQGSLISGGERQRIAIARALLRNPSLLILDEPTSALDSDTVQQIIATLQRLRKSTTILVIAHDLEVVRNADIIYVMDQGHIIERGNWHDLLNRRGQFFNLALLQGRTFVPNVAE